MAPTRPLVAQQVKACHDAVGFPENETAEMSGSSNSECRRKLWSSKRVFYATPQTVINDLNSGVLNPNRIVLLVIDEAHKALKKYAYCLVVHRISQTQCHFRILALSATPGRDTKSVQHVINNLRIAHVEVRTEDDPEVEKYTHARLIERVLCQASAAARDLEAKMNELCRPILTRLERAGAIRSNDANKVKPYNIVTAMQQHANLSHVSYVDLALAQKLLIAFHALLSYGPDGCANKLEAMRASAEHARKQISNGQTASSLDRALIRLIDTCEFSQCHAILHNKKKTEDSQEHCKTTKLREILIDHFERARAARAESRAMIFTGTRQSVDEIATALDPQKALTDSSLAITSNRLIRVQRFVGQASMKQSVQRQAVERFHTGHCNVLVATCVAEEGLDIGSVDLCIFYDQIGSPIRLTQRMGRTGRKRTGRVVLLVQPGEIDKFDAGNKKNLHLVQCLRSANSALTLRTDLNKRMVPKSLVPDFPQLIRSQLVIDEWHVSQVAGACGGAKRRRQKSNTAALLCASQLVLRDWQLSPDQHDAFFDRPGWFPFQTLCHYKPKLADGWRRTARSGRAVQRRQARVQHSDLIHSTSIRLDSLRNLNHFVRFQVWETFYDERRLSVHNGDHNFLQYVQDNDDQQMHHETNGLDLLSDSDDNDDNKNKVSSKKNEENFDVWGWDADSDDNDKAQEKKPHDLFGWDNPDDLIEQKKNGKVMDLFGWDESQQECLPKTKEPASMFGLDEVPSSQPAAAASSSASQQSRHSQLAVTKSIPSPAFALPSPPIAPIPQPKPILQQPPLPRPPFVQRPVPKPSVIPVAGVSPPIHPMKTPQYQPPSSQSAIQPQLCVPSNTLNSTQKQCPSETSRPQLSKLPLVSKPQLPAPPKAKRAQLPVSLASAKSQEPPLAVPTPPIATETSTQRNQLLTSDQRARAQRNREMALEKMRAKRLRLSSSTGQSPAPSSHSTAHL
eukprot:CAMPEP_0197319104 /NCGR_PEP_ID=MMETSP0891-20130614/53451_1 /TAXON_ID=44058 ORGANISM="Aureoumbra lagunensis, Strain CCMP1510" /NCGR_SAMPLE_ID=MMETSP0891 /ASSEMBLY_ACC=CAM_ASM_000534 /LENGTH=964 /DNA_ID=CAMNT_0042809869 /DNA_START=311 /DNA_END=3205 /DNA_ORIENTATION=-